MHLDYLEIANYLCQKKKKNVSLKVRLAKRSRLKLKISNVPGGSDCLVYLYFSLLVFSVPVWLWNSRLRQTCCRFQSHIWCMEFVTKRGLLQRLLQRVFYSVGLPSNQLGYRNLQRFPAGESVTPREGSTQQTVMNLDCRGRGLNPRHLRQKGTPAAFYPLLDTLRFLTWNGYQCTSDRQVAGLSPTDVVWSLQVFYTIHHLGEVNLPPVCLRLKFYTIQIYTGNHSR